jgi:hypothetical protein
MVLNLITEKKMLTYIRNILTGMLEYDYFSNV